MIRMHERTAVMPVWRQRLIMGGALMVFAVLLGGAFWRGTLQGEMLAGESDRRYIDNERLHGERGVIWDRNGRPLAVSALVYSAYVNPTLFRQWAQGAGESERDEAAAQLAGAFDIDARQIDKILARQTGFAYLRHSLSPERMRSIKALDLPHLRFERRYRRFYPAAQEAAHVTGFTDRGGEGRAGIEGAAHGELAPQEGQLRVLRTASGEVLEQFSEIPAVDGSEIVLTIDARLQYFASIALARAVDKHEAISGSLVLIDVTNGDILAIANVPTYNPNSIDSDTKKRRNRAVQDIFEPGSTMKPVLAAIAIEAGKVEPATLLKTAKPIRYGRYLVKDKKIDTDLNLSEVLMRSSNVGAVRVADMLDDRVMWEGYRRFGYGSGRLLDLPGETVGQLRDHATWRPVEKATMAYGYGLNANLLQVARAYAAIANDGMLPGLGIIRGAARQQPARAVSAATAAKVVQMLENVVSTAGTAPQAAIGGYRVAGKTGTSHKNKENEKGYNTTSYQSIFVGFAPASRPRFVAAVLVDEPSKNGYYGGTVAAPVFSEVVGHALRMYSVAPDRIASEEDEDVLAARSDGT